jgi:surfeit locus 1 family protein
MASWRRSRAVILLATLAAAALTARLGVWQLDRAAQKTAIQTHIEQRGTMPPLPVAELARSAEQAAAQHYRHITLHGQWLASRTVYLDNRPMNGRSGFIVVTPLLLSVGDAVMVQRGWMPRDPQDRTRLQPLPTPSGEVTLTGRIAPEPSRLLEFAAVNTGAIRQNLDAREFAQEIGHTLRPLSIQQLDGPDAPPDGLQRQWPMPAVDVGKHHGYAFQWFALCALILGLYVWFQLLRPRSS